ncbi:hypothetical protein BCR44DRAFT_1442319 [Catenaria anguillulae PL171]|uniref:Uncharacterized protein n=1 Tax=Catenaria anguillulae PL171 TaxID=765915 RepID=A0A1Y2HCL7_9FUNG|nr:hypothetical protein BCR44DRAFT_1442319 [Catenaria anguillulae PL171]
MIVIILSFFFIFHLSLGGKLRKNAHIFLHFSPHFSFCHFSPSFLIFQLSCLSTFLHFSPFSFPMEPQRSNQPTNAECSFACRRHGTDRAWRIQYVPLKDLPLGSEGLSNRIRAVAGWIIGTCQDQRDADSGQT